MNKKDLLKAILSPALAFLNHSNIIAMHNFLPPKKVKNRSELHRACLNYQTTPDNISAMIANGIPMNTTDNDNKTPLYYACEKYRPDLITRLLEEGANPILRPSKLPINATVPIK